MTRITFKGSGDLNGVVIINKTIEVDDQLVRGYTGQNRDAVILSTLAIHYPGVRIDPRNIGMNIEGVKEVKQAKPAKATKVKATQQSSNNNQEVAVPIGNKLDSVLEIEFNNDLNDTRKKLDFIFVQLSGHKWTDGNSDIHKENNALLNQCLVQYKVGFERLKSETNDLNILNLYKKQLSKLRTKKILGAYWVYLGILAFIIVACLFGLFSK
jgi:hypothetical protein